MTMPDLAAGDIGRPWRSTAFRSFVAADVLLSFGEEMIVVAIGWLVYQHTKSAFALGMVGLAGFLPAVLLSLHSGTIVDRYDRRSILVIGNAVLTIGALMLCFIAFLPIVWPVYVITAGMGAAKAFVGAATKAVMPNLVATGDFTRALAIAGTIGETAKLVGPVLGGVLFVLGPAMPFAVAAAVMLVATFCWFGLGRQPQRQVQPRSDWASVVAGYRFVWSQRIIFGAMSLDLVAVFLGGVTALLPIYVDKIFLSGPWSLGLLRTAPAIGAIVMAALLSWLPLHRFVGRILLAAVAVYGFATIGFGLSKSLAVALGFLAMLGAADTVSQIIRGSLLQLRTPDAMRGRVSAVDNVITGASNELGEFESGMLAAAFGAVPAVVLGGGAAIIVAVGWNWLFPALARADYMDEGKEG